MNIKLRNSSLLPDLMNEFLGNDFLPMNCNTFSGNNAPAVNIIEYDDDFSIEVSAPGLDKEDFKISFENNVLNISSEKEEEKEEKKEKYMRREFFSKSFKRSFSLPKTVDVEKINASHKNGVLNILLPKKEEEKVKPSRLIDIL